MDVMICASLERGRGGKSPLSVGSRMRRSWPAARASISLRWPRCGFSHDLPPVLWRRPSPAWGASRYSWFASLNIIFLPRRPTDVPRESLRPAAAVPKPADSRVPLLAPLVFVFHGPLNSSSMLPGADHEPRKAKASRKALAVRIASPYSYRFSACRRLGKSLDASCYRFHKPSRIHMGQ